MSSSTPRPVQDIDVSAVLGGNVNVKVSRLTARGADAVTGATFAGQDWTIDGTAKGAKVVESMSAQHVLVGDSEGVLVEL